MKKLGLLALSLGCVLGGSLGFAGKGPGRDGDVGSGSESGSDTIQPAKRAKLEEGLPQPASMTFEAFFDKGGRDFFKHASPYLPFQSALNLAATCKRTQGFFSDLGFSAQTTYIKGVWTHFLNEDPSVDQDLIRGTLKNLIRNTTPYNEVAKLTFSNLLVDFSNPNLQTSQGAFASNSFKAVRNLTITWLHSNVEAVLKQQNLIYFFLYGNALDPFPPTFLQGDALGALKMLNLNSREEQQLFPRIARYNAQTLETVCLNQTPLTIELVDVLKQLSSLKSLTLTMPFFEHVKALESTETKMQQTKAAKAFVGFLKENNTLVEVVFGESYLKALGKAGFFKAFLQQNQKRSKPIAFKDFEIKEPEIKIRKRIL